MNLATPAALAVAAGAASTTAFAHDGTLHGKASTVVRKEQKDCGMAGNAKSSRRPIDVSMGDDEPCMAHVAPGLTATPDWTFKRAGEFGFACLIADHHQAGMVGKVRVVAAGSRS